MSELCDMSKVPTLVVIILPLVYVSEISRLQGISKELLQLNPHIFSLKQYVTFGIGGKNV